MALQECNGRKDALAVSAVEPFARVYPHVGVEGRFLRKRLVAMLAIKLPLFGMQDHMRHQVLVLFEGAGAQIALEGPFAFRTFSIITLPTLQKVYKNSYLHESSCVAPALDVG